MYVCILVFSIKFIMGHKCNGNISGYRAQVCGFKSCEQLLHAKNVEG
jgi:uncharacterized ferredoxin-like protein